MLCSPNHFGTKRSQERSWPRCRGMTEALPAVDSRLALDGTKQFRLEIGVLIIVILIREWR